MKTRRSFIVGILLLMNSVLLAQYHNSAYVTILPGELGLGARVDHRFNILGLYGTYAHGNYRMPQKTEIRNHSRYSIGVSYYLIEGSFTCGIVSHQYGKILDPYEMIPAAALKQYSFELGGGMRHGHFVAGFRYDVLRYEGMIDIGFTFGTRSRKNFYPKHIFSY